MKKLLFLAAFVFLTTLLSAQSFTTLPPATANVGAAVTIAGSAPVANPWMQGFSFLILWTQTPDGTWTNQIMASSAVGTMSGSRSVTLTAATGSSGGTWHFAIGAVRNTAVPSTHSAPTGSYASASTVVGTPITAATLPSFTYNGSAQWPTSVSSVSPAGATVSVSAAPHTNAGNYTTTVNGTGNYRGTLTVSWSIHPASISNAIIPSRTYNGSAQSPTSVSSISPAGAPVTVSAPSQTNANTYATATVTANSSNYTGTLHNVAWTIAPATQAAVVVTSASSMNYGDAYVATAAGGSGSGAFNWALGSGSTATGAYINPATGAVAANGTGTVVIRVRRAADTNHQVSGWTTDFTITVHPRPITVSLGGNKTYNGNATASGASATVSAGSLAGGDTISYSYSAAPSPNHGSYSGLVTATLSNASAPTARTGNYAISYAGAYTINQAPLVSASFSPLTYLPGQAQSPSVASTTPAGALSSVSVTGFSPQIDAHVDYPASVTANAGSNYTGTISVPWTIQRREITAATIASLGYNASPQAPTSVNSVSPGGATVTVSAAAQTNVGNYTATVEGSGNYTASLSVPWSIIQATTQAVTSLAGRVTFGQSFTPSISGYFGTGANQWTVTGQFGFTAVGAWTAPAADSYSFQVRNVGDTNYASSTSGAYVLTIDQATPAGAFASRALPVVSGATGYFVTAVDLNASFAHPTNGSVAAPTGTVTYRIATGSPGGTPGAAVASGTALPLGTYLIQANYPGDTNYTSASVTATWQVVLPGSIADQLDLENPDQAAQPDAGNATGLKINQPQ
jgi:hypothetical protein